MLHKILCTWLRTSTRRRTAEEFRDTMSGSEMEVEVVMAATTPPRNNLTQRIYSLQPPSPQPHAGCWLTWTWSLFYYAFKPPSKREVNKSLGSSEFTSILTLSPVSGSAVCSSTNIFIFFINRWSMWIFEASRKKYCRETLYSLWQYMNKDGNYKQLSHLIMW